MIVKVHGHGSFRNRIVEMGFVKGEKVTVIKNAPLRDPIEYKLMDSHISLRRSEARLIEVVNISLEEREGYNGTFTEEDIARVITERSKTLIAVKRRFLTVLLDCGKRLEIMAE